MLKMRLIASLAKTDFVKFAGLNTLENVISKNCSNNLQKNKIY
jgi:hypothetical protein